MMSFTNGVRTPESALKDNCLVLWQQLMVSGLGFLALSSSLV